MITLRRMRDTIITGLAEGRDPEALVKGDTETEKAAPDKKEEEKEPGPEEGMAQMRMKEGGILAQRDEKHAKRP